MVLAVWLQLIFPGMDFLAAGLILCLQREQAGKAAFLTLICILIQEGSGSLAFGASILRYGSLIGFFLIGQRLFQADSAAFIVLLGLVFSAMHFFTLKTMAGLQDWVILDHRLFLESGILFFVFLVEWFILFKIYLMFSPHASRS